MLLLAPSGASVVAGPWCRSLSQSVSLGHTLLRPATPVLWRRASSDLPYNPSQRFCDSVIVHAVAGNGGNGVISFARGPNKRVAPPDGGRGGNGGNVYLEASDRIRSFSSLRTHIARAKSGGGGAGAKRMGATGEDFVLPVPVGTMVYAAPVAGAEQTQPRRLLADIRQLPQRLLVARGGEGGRGNASYASSTNRSPKQCEKGRPGQEIRLQLELKTIADVGLVGMPNAGKRSVVTLLTAISRANTRIASYPFTTLHPVVGVVTYDDGWSMRVADVPGLVEGAHVNRGLGHRFLKHIERTSVLCFVVDCSIPSASLAVGQVPFSPAEQLRVLVDELREYDPTLLQRPWTIVANKSDLDSHAAALAEIRDHIATAHYTQTPTLFSVCARNSGTLGNLIAHLRTLVSNRLAETGADDEQQTSPVVLDISAAATQRTTRQ